MRYTGKHNSYVTPRTEVLAFQFESNFMTGSGETGSKNFSATFTFGEEGVDESYEEL